ncbi:hypothetical protein Nepgr_023314 [Nepenthes gracilis]|uniref:TFIIS N-terminal domain-containing protein n=1 Tax=Nepenthes gracilis TaxID=150966 RepID=A0AAD3T2C2_NEPGR|nr:hypothetical protein Nepgr_023314 [Nepenthes gracilis]
MHATMQQQQQGGRSPKPMNGPTSTSQLKQCPDVLQNSTSSFPSQSKGKKRARTDQVSEASKREHFLRTNHGDVSHLKSESFLKSEIAKVAERGGLVDFEGVERLVQLMQPEKPERKIDLTSRSMFAGVIAATDNVDCLNQFVQLRGLLVLDKWLQEVHKGKVGDSSSPKDSDRSVEDFLLVLLRALDRLPVNLNALQMCNIGKSVNHLRSHRNSEIQKKARSLVDTWKRRVEAEMNIGDAKSGSGHSVPWPARPRHEVSHGGNRQTDGSSDVVTRSSLTQLSPLKSASSKIVQGEANGKSSPGSPTTLKSSSSTFPSTNIRDGQARISFIGGNSEPPQTVAREEKSSSSCSSEHAKSLVPSVKGDARSSTAGSSSMNKITASASRYQRSPNGLHGTAASGVQREAISSRHSSSAKISASEKQSQSLVTWEMNLDAPFTEGNDHKLIVNVPNQGRSPAQSIIGESMEDPSFTNSRASSPELLVKHDQSDCGLKEDSGAYQPVVTSDMNAKHDQSNRGSKEDSGACQPILTSDMNTKSWQSNDLKGGGSDERDGSPAVASDCEHHRTGDDTAKLTDIAKAASLSSGNDIKSRKPFDSSFSSLIALIESCFKCSEVSERVLMGDDGGMNLLASVATGEISESCMASLTDSPAAIVDEACIDNTGISQVNGDNLGCQSGTPGKHMQQNGDSCLRSSGKSEELIGVASLPVSSTCTLQKTVAVNDGLHHDNKETLKYEIHDLPLEKAVEVSSSCLSAVVVDEKKKYVYQGLINDASTENKPFDLVSYSESMNKNELARITSSAVKDLSLEKFNNQKVEETDTKDVDSHGHVEQEGNRRIGQERAVLLTSQSAEESSSGFTGTDQKDTCNKEKLSSKETICHGFGLPASQKDLTIVATENKPSRNSKGLKLETIEGKEAKEHMSNSAAAAAAALPLGNSDIDGKVEFDLNEGLIVEDGKVAESVTSSTHVYEASDSSRLIGSLLSFPMSSAPVGLPASITIAAAAKGPFLPPEDLLRNKGELGWRGSAATSAFRPTRSAPHSDAAAACKQARPPWDIDLNVADESMLEDTGCQISPLGKSNLKNDDCFMGGSVATASFRCSGGLDLDLNKVDESPEAVQQSNSHRFEVSLLPSKSCSSSGFFDACGRRNFDLNNGPAVDEAIPESSLYNQQARANFLAQPPVRINNIEIGNLPSWYPPGSTYPTVPIPSFLPDRREQPFPIVGASNCPQRILGTGSTLFNPDAYGGSMLSSSAAIPFPSTPFQYPVFPFGTSFPVPSSSFSASSTAYVDLSLGGRLCIPAVHSQLAGTTTAVSSQYPRPHVVTLTDITHNSGVDGSRKFGRNSLDLNAGPGVPDVEVRNEIMTIPSRRVPGVDSLALAEEQSRMFVKRKEPEGGWTGYRKA